MAEHPNAAMVRGAYEAVNRGVLAEATATRGAETLTYRVAEIVHLRDGKITERWAFSDDTAAIVDFFARS